MADDDGFRPWRLRVSEEEFVAQLAELMNQTVEVPADGRWHLVTLSFQIRASGASGDGPDGSPGGFLLRRG